MSACEYFIGVDLGQTRDHTAIAVVERTDIRLRERDWVTWEFLRETRSYLRHLDRVVLGTSYPDVVRIVCDAVADVERFGPCTLVVDATGVGAPVVDLLREAGLHARVVAVTITGADGVSRRPNGDWLVPKRDLVTGLQLMLQQEELRIASGIRAGDVLVKELREMRVKVGVSGHENFEAWRSGAHDDLVLATALACWRSRLRIPSMWGTRRLVGPF
jgi:hypothetical protein